MSTNCFTIINVHGTWGRGFFPTLETSGHFARWYEPDSNFCRRLTSALAHQRVSHSFCYLEWSGANSFKARDKAASALADMILEIHQDQPQTRIVCIGHSHGGNIILRALDLVKQHEISIDVVTLATPFTSLFYQEEEKSSDLFSHIKMIVYFYSLFPLFYLFNSYFEDYFSFLTICIMFFVCFVVLVIAIVLCFVWSNEIGVYLLPWTEVKFPRCATKSILILRGIDDEASLVLTLGRMGVLLGAMLKTVLSAATIAVFFVVVFCAFFRKDQLEYFWFIGSLTIAIISIGLPIIASTLRASAGRELLAPAIRFDVAINSSPDIGYKIDIAEPRPEIFVKTFQQSRSWWHLRHAIYESSETSNAIAYWLKFLSCEYVRQTVKFGRDTL